MDLPVERPPLRSREENNTIGSHPGRSSNVQALRTAQTPAQDVTAVTQRRLRRKYTRGVAASLPSTAPRSRRAKDGCSPYLYAYGDKLSGQQTAGRRWAQSCRQSQI
jgi:hypothetical protein